MITCPYCKEEFEKNYYEKNHVPCPMDRGDGWVWEEAPKDSQPGELEALRKSLAKAARNFADIMRRVDEDEDIPLAEVDEAGTLLAFALTRYQIKKRGFRSVPLEQAVKDHPHATLVWDPGVRKEA